MRVIDPKHSLFFVLILCWSSELWLRIQAKKYNPNDSNSHKCKSYEMVREDITAKCINYFKLTKRSTGFESYELNHERSNLIDVSDERMEELIEQWKNGTDQGPDCYFSRLMQKAVIECCGGWEKPLCIKPACDPPCLNGGICSQPGTCDCLPDFAGSTCEDDKKNVNSKRKYCYLNRWCYGAKPNSTRHKRYKDLSFSEVMDKVTCCSLEGAGGWGLAGESCEACPAAPLEDSSDFVPDLPKVVLNKDDLPFRTCIGMGPNYWRSFDGIEFLFPGRCAYTLLDSDLIKVTVKMVDCYSFVKCRKRLNIFFKEHLLAVVEGAQIMIGGKFTQVNQVQGYSDPVNGLKIERRGDYFYLQLLFVRLRWDENSTFFLTLEKSGDIKTKGICGDYNGNPYDDLKTPGGLKVTHPLEFGNSWVVVDDLEQCPTAETYGYPCNTTALENKALDSCGKIWQAPFRSCHSSVHPNPYFERCVSDYCTAEQYSREYKLSEVDRQKELQSVICQAFGSYSQICALREVPFNWRSAHLCPRRCPYGMMYTECAPKCMKTCQNLYLDPNPLACSDKECSPGCQCLAGTFFNGSHCVPANRCPCIYRGEHFYQGSSINIGCNLCQCNYGRWKCTKKMCSKICSVIGYQHFNTFDGNKFDFHGPEGSYTLVEYFSSPLEPSDTSGLERGDLSIIYSVTKCLLMSPDTSCISGFRVELKAGYKMYIVTINKNFEVLLNGEILDDPAIRPFNDLNLYVKKVTSLFIAVQGYGFRILYDRHGRLYVRLEPFYSGKVQGLCGNMDGSVQNDYKSRNGIEEDLLSFAMSYSHGAGSVDDAHLAGDTCSSSYGSATLYAERHCTLVGKEEIFGPCLAVLVDWNRYFDICMQDSCASPGSPEPICTALAALAERCAAAGFELEPNWMAHPEVFDLCGSVEGYQCQYGQVFSDCAPHQPSCRDNQFPSHIPDDDTCIAGCKCGNIGDLQDHQSVCVPREDCSCYEYISKKVYKAKEIWKQACGNCICSNATWDCSKSNCGKTIKCPFNQIFISNATSCGSTCVSLDTPGYCDVNEFRFDGCTCPSGTVLHPEGNCVPPEECPCSYSSKLFQARETVTIGCKTFQCQNRRWKLVSKSNCRAICSATGDPHYKTFDGRCYSFQGPCEYIMTQEKSEKLFIVTLENVPCGSQGVTCTKSVTVKVKNTVIKLMKGLEVTINDVPVDSTRPRTFFGGIMVSSGLFVVLSFHLGFDVMWDGGTRVYISMSDQHKNNVEGLCGNFDDNYQNEFQDLKSGSLISTPQSFGFKWRATNLCKSKGLADDFDPCKDFPERLKWAEPVCRVIKDHEMFEECRKLVTSFKEYYSNCIYDSCGCDHGNNCECTCTAIAAFAQECSFKGVYVNWRSNNLCPKMCEKGHEYKVCGSPCRQTCGDYGKANQEGCESSECVEGCFCPDGFYENDDGVCVLLAECKCFHEGNWLSPGTVVEVDCQTCTCSNAELSCGGKHCANNCTDDQYWCKNSTKCIPMARKCDGIVDCPEQFDELECAWKCKPEEFTCAFDGTCIPKSSVCNGFPDCGDESDESSCNQTCPRTFYKCATNRCIPISLICDGVEDCGLEDDSDEANCTEICNPIDFFRCDNSKCMPKTVKCDEVDDCGDGSDESDCASLSTISPSKLCPVDMSAVDFVHGEQTFSIRVNEEMDGSDALLGSRKHLVLTSPRQDFIVIDKPTPDESFTLRRISLWANGAITCEMKVVDINGEETKYRRKIVENMVSYEFDNGGLSDVLQILLYFESGYAVNVQNLEMLACVQEVTELGYGSKPYGMFPSCLDPQPLYFNSDLPSLITLYQQGFRRPVDAQDSLKFSPVSKWQVKVSVGNNYSYIVEIAKRCHGDWYVSAIEMVVEGIREFQMFVGSRVIKNVKLKDESHKFTYDQPIFGNHVGFAFKATKEILSISGFHLTACCLSPGLAETLYRRGTSRFPSGRPVGTYPEGRESSSPIGVGSSMPGMGKPEGRPGVFKPLKQTKPSFRREKITKRRKSRPGLVGLGGEFAENESTYQPGETKHFGAKEWDKWPAWFKTTLYPGKHGFKNKLKKQKKVGLSTTEPKRQFSGKEIPSGDTEGRIERPTKPRKASKGISISPGNWLIPSLKPKGKMYPEFDFDEENYDYFEKDESHLENLNKYPVKDDYSGDEDVYPGKPDYREYEDRYPKNEYPRDHVYFDEKYPEMQDYPEREGEYLEQYYSEDDYPEYDFPRSDKRYPEDEYYHADSEEMLDRPGMHWHKTTPYKKSLKTTYKWKPFTGWDNYGQDNAWWDMHTSNSGKFKPFFRSSKSQKTINEALTDGFWGENNDTSLVPLLNDQTRADLLTTPGTAGLCRKPYTIDFKCTFNYEAQLISENNMVIRDLTKSDIFRPKPLWTPPASLAGGFIIAITNLEACDNWFVVSVKFTLKGVTQFSVVIGTQSILSEMEIRGGEVTKIYKEGIFEGPTVEIVVEERRKRCSVYDVEVIYCCEFFPTTATTATTTPLTTTATVTSTQTTTFPTSTQTTTIPTTTQTTSVLTTSPTTVTLPTEMTSVTETTEVPTTISPQPASSCKMERTNVLEWAIVNSLPCQFPSSELEITTCGGFCESFTQGHVEFVNGPFINPVRSCQCCGGTGSFINVTGVNCTGPGFAPNQTQILTVFVYDTCSCQEDHCLTGTGPSSTTVKTTPAPLCDPKLPFVYVKPKSRNNFRIILQLQSSQPVTDRNIRDLISDKKYWSPPAILQKGFAIKVDLLEECSTQWIILGVKFQMKGVRTYSVAVGNTLVADYEDAEEGLSKFFKEGIYYGSSLVITIHKRYKELYINCVEMVACCGSTNIEMATPADDR